MPALDGRPAWIPPNAPLPLGDAMGGLARGIALGSDAWLRRVASAAGFFAFAAVPVWALLAFIALFGLQAAAGGAQPGVVGTFMVASLLTVLGFLAVWTGLTWIALQRHRARRHRWRRRYESNLEDAKARFAKGALAPEAYDGFARSLRAMLADEFVPGRSLMIGNLVFTMGAVSVLFLVPFGIVSWAIGSALIIDGTGGYQFAFALPGFVVSLGVAVAFIPAGMQLRRLAAEGLNAAQADVDGAEEELIASLHE
ncbi:MAG: hypothetical protein HYT80_12260, partial [Euryarchaeota archaeon]|nr:hypothetical protein [Euryarchaeota archaeon]